MSDRPTVGLALIVRDEAKTLPRLLESIEGAFDQVVLLDTGSKDQTVEVFLAWASQQANMTYRVGRFDWVDDFALARQAADAMLDTDWLVWADADDTIEGAQHLRELAARAPDQLAAFIANYAYAHDQHGNCVCTLKRERMVRAGAGTWVGRVHEAQVFQAPSTLLDDRIVRWVHHKAWDARPSSPRNLRILRAWVKDEPESPRVLGYLGTEEAAMGRHKRAVGYYKRYLKLKTGWDEERAQIHRKLARSLMALDRTQEALETALAALAVVPDWPDSHLTLAETSYKLGEWGKAAKWSREVLRLGQPDSLLILNPLDYTFQPRLVLAGALGALGHVGEALEVAHEALAIIPDHQELRGHAHGWAATVEREHVAEGIVAQARLLVRGDEQLKALTLLEHAVPYFAQDHPAVVAMRSQVRERLLWAKDPGAYARHYQEGGSKPEDYIADEHVMALVGSLPRALFLARGLTEQGRLDLGRRAIHTVNIAHIGVLEDGA